MKVKYLKTVVLQGRKKTTSTILLFIVFTLNLYTMVQAQETREPEPEELSCFYLCPKLHPNPAFRTTVNTADELYQTLTCLYVNWQLTQSSTLPCGIPNDALNCSLPGNPYPGVPSPWNAQNPITISLTGIIDMGELDASIFPIEVAPNVILQGTYQISSIKGGWGVSEGTRINFPYLYERGLENETFFGPPDPSPSCNQDKACVFKLRDGCQVKNICLNGPQDFMSDRRWDGFKDCTNPSLVAPKTAGLVGGIVVLGNKCRISFCEISNFNLWGVSVEDMLTISQTQTGANYVCNTVCYDPLSDPYGRFEFDHNYVHGCKSSGFAYGLYVSSGSGATSCNLVPNNPTCGQYSFINFKAPDEIAHIHDNIFMNNQMDIDGTGYRLSLTIENNTFGYNNLNNNFHMHNASNNTITVATCNPMFGATPLEPQVFLDNTGEPDVGGQQIKLNHNSFYKEKLNIDFTYPNINECDGTDPAGAPYTQLDATIEVNNNYFSTPGVVLSNLAAPPLGPGQWSSDLDWTSTTTTPYRQGHGKVQISGYHHFAYLFKDPFPAGDDNIQIGESTSLPVNKCQMVPFDAASLTPRAIIASVSDIEKQIGTLSNETDKVIEQGQKMWFDTRLCTDKSGINALNSTHTLLNLWGFNEPTGSGSLMEARADNTNAVTALPYTFNKIGINYVTLTAFDLTTKQRAPGLPDNDWSASDVTLQQITVTPPEPCGVMPMLTFWIKDNYNNKNMAPYGTYSNGVMDIRPGHIATPPSISGGGATGFEKFAAISDDGGVTYRDVWVQDISDDETAWQYVSVSTFLNGDPLPLSGNLQIGLRTRGQAPDARRIRGVSIFIDDVYINNYHCGYNVVPNGGFEFADQGFIPTPLNPTPNWVESWIPYSWPPSCGGSGQPPCIAGQPFDCDQCSCNFSVWSDAGMVRTTEEVRSGRYAIKGYVKPVNPDWDVDATTPGGTFTYAPNHIYKSVSVPYNINPYRIAQNSTFTFEVLPHPAASGQTIKLICTQKQNVKKNVEVVNASGKTVFIDSFNEAVYTLKELPTPGAYFVKIVAGNNVATQKMVIVK